MSRRLPPLPALRSFEAAAQRMSFTQAAADLCVTPSAVSHQIKALEDFLETALFSRGPAGLKLTQAGRDYLRDLTPLLDMLDASTRRVARRGTDEPIRILSTPGFAARWLVPRLHRFDAYNRVEITVSQGAPSTDFASNGADVVIHWGANPVHGVVVEPMMQSSRYPVASPALIEREKLFEPRDLLRVTLLHDELLDAWGEWFELAGIAVPALPRGPRLAHCELVLTAAERLQGVALAYDAMARGAIEEGELVRLFTIEIPPITMYSFAYPEGRRRCPAIGALRSWMFTEVAADSLRLVRSPDGLQNRALRARGVGLEGVPTPAVRRL